MCDHKCVHKVGRTQTTRDSTAKTVSNQKRIRWVVIVVNRKLHENSPNGTDPLITFLRFNLLDKLYKSRFMDKAKVHTAKGHLPYGLWGQQQTDDF